MKILSITLASLCTFFSTAHASTISATFHGTVTAVTDGTGQVENGDSFVGTFSLDPNYNYGYRIDGDQARFIWNAWDYQGPPSEPPPPLPIALGFQDLRTGAHFDAPVPGAGYDYSLVVPPYVTIDFNPTSYGQQLVFQTVPSNTSLYASLTIAGEGRAFYDETGPGMANIKQSPIITALSSAQYSASTSQGNLTFDLALTDFTFIPSAVPEPGGLSLMVGGFLMLGVVARRLRRH